MTLQAVNGLEMKSNIYRNALWESRSDLLSRKCRDFMGEQGLPTWVVLSFDLCPRVKQHCVFSALGKGSNKYCVYGQDRPPS